MAQVSQILISEMISKADESNGFYVLQYFECLQ